MHLCLICEEYPPCKHGGIGSVSRDLAEGLVHAGHAVTVVGIYKPNILVIQHTKDEWVNGVRVVRLPSSMGKLRYRLSMWWDRVVLSRWINRNHKMEAFDLIETPDYGGWLIFNTPKDVPVICRSHGSKIYGDAELQRDPGRSPVNYFERRQIERADHLLFISEYTAHRSLELFKQETRKHEVIYNAVDTQFFSPALDILVEEGKIVFVNSISPRKGAEEMVKAFNLVRTAQPQARLYMIGKQNTRWRDGRAYVEHLKDVISPDATDRVMFTGHVSRDEVLYHLRTAQVCCFPSYGEAFAIAPLEAMAVGKPTIFTRTSSGPEAIEDGVSGLLCDPRDPGDIAEKLYRILEDGELARRLGGNARQRVLERFDKREWLGKNVAYYQRILEDPGDRR